jgi:hypothetical protein
MSLTDRRFTQIKKLCFVITRSLLQLSRKFLRLCVVGNRLHNEELKDLYYLTKYYSADQEGDELATWHPWGNRRGACTQGFGGERDHVEDIDVDGRWY